MEETRILVVEDEAITSMDIKNRLEKLKYNVVGTAFTGEEAIENAGKLKPDLILMDIILKGNMDGTTAAQTISQLYGIPIIYLTAYNDADTFNRAKLCIPYGYIAKPFETRTLQIAIEMAVYKREMEDKLALSEKRNQLLMENASCGFIVHDLHGIVYDTNKVGEKILGANKSGILNKDFRNFVVPDEQEYVAVQLNKLHIEKKIDPVVVHILQPSGEIREVELSGVCVTLNSKDIILSVINDITEITKIRNQTLLADKLASVGTLAVGIIHEINNPLNSITANLEFIREKIKKIPETDTLTHKLLFDLGEIIDESMEGTSQISKIVKYLKGFSRIDEKNLVSMDIHHEIKSALNIAKPQLQKIKIETNFNENIPLILTQTNKLQQVFLNLIMNAAQAFPQTRDQDNIIKILTEMDKNKIKISFIDNGTGIERGSLKKIFEPFFTTKPAGIGTGLGLSICYDIIHAMGGNITVNSILNVGTYFTIYLPLNMKAESLAKDKIGLEPSTRLKILIVDDMPILLKSLHRILMDSHEVTDALGGREALRILEKNGNHFDLLIADVHMPDVSGADLYRYIAEKYPVLKDRIIFVSGGSLSTGTDKFLSTVKNTSLQKPFTREELFMEVNKFCK